MACGLTHFGITPLDVTKCNMQVYPGKYTGLVSGIKTIMKEEGAMALWKGWGPTLVGYSMQGAGKYGLYELFKDQYMTMLGEETSTKYKGLIWVSASASAEFFADILLCPSEMVKVKVQTSPPGTWPTGFAAATAKMWAEKASTRYPFGSLVPLWSRQIPYTVAKFYFFEKVRPSAASKHLSLAAFKASAGRAGTHQSCWLQMVQLFYTHVFTAPKETYSKTTQLGVTFASGYSAGVICAIVSHPADSLVSLMGKAENKGKSLGQIASETGIKTLATKGLGTRVLMIGTLTGFQWWCVALSAGSISSGLITLITSRVFVVV